MTIAIEKKTNTEWVLVNEPRRGSEKWIFRNVLNNAEGFDGHHNTKEKAIKSISGYDGIQVITIGSV